MVIFHGLKFFDYVENIHRELGIIIVLSLLSFISRQLAVVGMISNGAITIWAIREQIQPISSTELVFSIGSVGLAITDALLSEINLCDALWNVPVHAIWHILAAYTIHKACLRCSDYSLKVKAKMK